MAPSTHEFRQALSRNALGLWFCGLAALGALRCWMKIVREGQTPWPPDVWSWIVGTAICAVVGIALLLRERSRRAVVRASHSAEGSGAS